MSEVGRPGGFEAQPRPALSRESVLRAAIELVDAEGLERLSLRRLGERLGVTAMAIYKHVPSKQALRDGIADLIAGEIEPPATEVPWEERLRKLLSSTRSAYLRHPNAIPVIQTTRALTPALLRPVEHALEALADGGFDQEAALEAWTALIGLTSGHVAYQLNRHLMTEDRRPPPVPAGRFPFIAGAMSSGPLDFDRAFEAALDALIRGLHPEMP